MARHLGLKYIYEEPLNGAAAPSEYREPDYPLLQSELQSLDPAWLASLYNAAARADAEAVLELIEPIRGDHLRLAGSLTRLVNDFRFDVLAKMGHSADEETEP